MVSGAVLFSARRGMDISKLITTPRFIWERSLIMAAVVLTAIGLLLFEDYLRDKQGHLMARVGAFVYSFGATLVLTAEGIRLTDGQTVYPLVVLYVVLAFLGQGAVGVALVQFSGYLSSVGWVVIAWNLAWLIILPITSPGDVYFPVLHHLMPLLMGIPLLMKG